MGLIRVENIGQLPPCPPRPSDRNTSSPLEVGASFCGCSFPPVIDRSGGRLPRVPSHHPLQRKRGLALQGSLSRAACPSASPAIHVGPPEVLGLLLQDQHHRPWGGRQQNKGWCLKVRPALWASVAERLARSPISWFAWGKGWRAHPCGARYFSVAPTAPAITALTSEV